MYKVAITGGTGFLGSHLVDFLLKRKLLMKLIVRKEKLSYARKRYHDKKIEILKGDITKKNTIRTALKGCDCLFHFAALTPRPMQKIAPALYKKTNVDGTVNLLNEVIRSDVPMIIFSSAWIVYGRPLYLPIDEQHPLNPETPYAISKAEAEKYILDCAHTHDVTAYILRLSSIFGPNSLQRGAIYNFIEKASNNEGPVIFGNGKQKRDYLFVDDAVRAAVLPMDKKPKSKIFNIGSGHGIEISELAAKIVKIYNEDYNKKIKKPVYSDVDNKEGFSAYLNISLARKELGFRPKIDLDAGLKRTIDGFEKTGDKFGH